MEEKVTYRFGNGCHTATRAVKRVSIFLKCKKVVESPKNHRGGLTVQKPTKTLH